MSNNIIRTSEVSEVLRMQLQAIDTEATVLSGFTDCEMPKLTNCSVSTTVWMPS